MPYGNECLRDQVNTTLESDVSDLTKSRSYLTKIRNENKRALTHFPIITASFHVNPAKIYNQTLLSPLLTFDATFNSRFTHSTPAKCENKWQ